MVRLPSFARSANGLLTDMSNFGGNEKSGKKGGTEKSGISTCTKTDKV
jgi:hypothetical protein